MPSKQDRTVRRTPVYTISVASQLIGLPIHTVRWLETNGFVHPFRTPGNRRLFSEEDVELLREIAELLSRRVNAAGIRAILTIKQTYRIERLDMHESHGEEQP